MYKTQRYSRVGKGVSDVNTDSRQSLRENPNPCLNTSECTRSKLTQVLVPQLELAWRPLLMGTFLSIWAVFLHIVRSTMKLEDRNNT